MTQHKESEILGELRRLAAVYGTLQPSAVVNSARDPESPLHDSFEWDDSEAAEQWRLQQARQLIRVMVRYEVVGDGKLIPCRVFVSLSSDRKEGGDGYRLLSEVLSNEEQKQRLLADAREDMKRFQSKYRSLAELARVFEAIDEVVLTEKQPIAVSA